MSKLTAKPKPKGKATSAKPNPNPIKHTLESIYPVALKASLDPDNVFMQDVTSSVPCSIQTFYALMKNTQEFETIKNNLDRNKITLKQSLRVRWKDSDNATLQISLYKLLSTDEEFAKLANLKEDKHDETPITVRLVPNKLAGEDD